MQASTAARLKGKNGVHDAVKQGDVNVVQDYLIADVSCQCGSCSFNKWTPLHIAASEGHIEIVQLLLSCNAAVDARDTGYRPYSCITFVEKCVANFVLCCVSYICF